jgi:branched-chain amino acid transport system substrate-binding protein
MRASRGLLAAPLALCVACALIADIPDSVSIAQPASCKKPIRIRFFDATASVTVADVALPVFLGAVDHLREIQETGGIRGCPLEYASSPKEYDDSAKAVEIYDAWTQEPDWDAVVAVFAVSSADALALGPKVTSDKRVLISTAYNGTLASPNPVKVPVDVPEVTFVPGTPSRMNETSLAQDVESKGYPYVFFTGTDYSTAMRTAMYHVNVVDPGARIGWVHCAANEFCLNPLPAGKSYAKELGLGIGRDLLAELTDTAARYAELLVPYFAAEAQATVDDPSYRPVSWLWSGNLTAGTFFLATALSAVQSGPKPGDVSDVVWAKAKTILANTKIIANNYGFDESLAASLCPAIPSGPAPCKRIFGVVPFLAFGDLSTGSSAMPTVVALHDKWRQRDVSQGYSDAAAIVDAGLPIPTTQSVRYIQGYMNVELFKMGIERLFDQHKEITGENLKAVLESFQSEDTGGLTAPLSFSPDDHRPQSTVSIYTLDFTSIAPGTPGSLQNIPPTRRISLKKEWLGW